MHRTALIVIDVQESFRHTPYWSESDLPEYLARQQALIDGCAARGVPVVQIFHTGAQGPFSIASGHVRCLAGLTIAPAVTIHKQHHSAFAGTDLAAWLTGQGVNRLIVSGIRTEQCCETTTRYASDTGFAVDFVTEASVTLEDGRRVSVLTDWPGDGPRGPEGRRFLTRIREGACRVFSTVLGPGYNEAHANHLHLDGAPYSLCT